MKPKPGDMVEIIWNDTHTPRTMDWMENSAYMEWAKVGMTIRSIGLITMIDDKHHYLVANIDVCKKAADRTVCGAINIPNGAIKESHVLKRMK